MTRLQIVLVSLTVTVGGAAGSYLWWRILAATFGGCR